MKFNLEHKLVRLFIYSAAMLLFLTGAAKIYSGFGRVRILDTSDPVFHISYRILFWITGILELTISGVCVWGRSHFLKLLAIAWIATGFSVYRIGMAWVGYKRPCPCLGTLTDALQLSPQIADLIMKLVLAYLLSGSIIFLIRNKILSFQKG